MIGAMQWGVLAQAAGSDTNWAVLLITALGASFVGGVLGGALTTWMRGRIEREEAWRTRLIEAADEFMRLNAKSGLQGGVCLHRFKDPDAHMMDGDGEITDAGRVETQPAPRRKDRGSHRWTPNTATPFGSRSAAAVAAARAVNSVRVTIKTLEGESEEGPDLTSRDSRLELAEENLVQNVEEYLLSSTPLIADLGTHRNEATMPGRRPQRSP